MEYQIIKKSEVFSKEKFGIKIDAYPVIDNCEIAVVETESGHNQEFYDKISVFNYIILDGFGSFFVNDEEVKVQKGDFISIKPNSRLYYRGKMRLVLITTPPWQAGNEVETKSVIW